MEERKVLLQGICYDAKSSFLRGAAKAPPLIRERLWSEAYNRFAENGIEILRENVIDCGDAAIGNYEEIEKITSDHLHLSNRILTLGGDHSITYPVVKALSKVWNDFEILHIDAHSDLYDIFEGDYHSHACPFARIMEEGLTSRLVQIGIRTLTTHQREQAERFGVEIVEMKDFKMDTIPLFNKPIYISLDMDAFDPAFAPGVSHQESGGLNVREVLGIIDNIAGPIIGGDIVEFNPQNDSGGITAALCAKMAKEFIARMF